MLLPVLVVAIAVAYFPSFRAPFIFDDLTSIPGNGNIKSLWPLSQSLQGPPATTVSGRPVICLTLAINYAMGGLNPFGYHVFNLLVHICCSVLAFLILRGVFRTERLRDSFWETADWYALAITTIWALHPLATETVTYVIQRTESVMAFFYLLTIYAAMRSWRGQGSRGWQVVAIIACILGMLSKESMVTAPVAVLLIDRMLYSGSFAAALRGRLVLYLGLLASWLVLAGVLAGQPRGTTVGFDQGVAPLAYLQTQAGVILWYLRLSVWPDALSISYDGWPVAERLSDCALAGSVILLLLVATGWGWYRRKPAALLGIWFFIILSPTSSFVPIATEFAAERRMYLPLLAVVAALVMVVVWLGRTVGHRLHLGMRPAATIVALALAAILVWACHERNRTYGTAKAIWSDTVSKRPDNPTARTNLGTMLLNEGDLDGAIAEYREAVRLKEDNLEAVYNLANALADSGRLPEALVQYERAKELKPDDANVLCNTGIALDKLGRGDDAENHYRKAIAVDTALVGPYHNLANLLARMHRAEDAFEVLRSGLKANPDSVRLHSSLGDLFLDAGRFESAIEQYQEVLKLDPGRTEARFDLAIALATSGQRERAIDELRVVLKERPDYPGAQAFWRDLTGER